MNQTYMTDFDPESNSVLNPYTLSLEAQELYNGYCSILKLATLPEDDRDALEKIAKDYFIPVLLDFIRGMLKGDKESIKKAFKEGRIKDFRYFVPLIERIADKTAIKKVNYRERYKTVGAFLKAYANNEKFQLIKRFFDENGRDFEDSDVGELARIVDTYSVFDIEDSISRCNRDGNPICNVNFLSKVVKEVFLDAERDKKKLERANWEEDVRIKMMNMERVLNEREIQETHNPYAEEDAKLIQEILALRSKND